MTKIVPLEERSIDNHIDDHVDKEIQDCFSADALNVSLYLQEQVPERLEVS